MEPLDAIGAPRRDWNGASRTASAWLQVGLFLTILFAYLLGEGRAPPYNDSRTIYTVAESIVYRKAIDIPVPSGKFYAPQPFLTSAIHVPGAAIRWAITKSSPAADKLVKPMTSHLGSQLVAALGCLVFFRLLLYLGISLGAASVGTLFLGFATMLPIYSRTAWSEALQATCFIGFYSALMRLKDSPGCRTGLWFGIWTGLLINSKYAFALVLPGALLFLVYHAWRGKQLRALLRAGAWSALLGAFFLAIILWYNWARTGVSTNSGYPTVAGLAESVFREDLFFGLWSYLFSFGKSIFLYSPPLVLSLVALPLVAKRHAANLWALILTAGPIVCLYSKFVFWSGDWCWGPRYLLFVVPAMLLPAAFLIDEYLIGKRRIALAACGAVFLVGLWVQVVGASQYWDHFIRFSKTAQIQWLGSPNRTGALTPDHGGSCDPCFEDFYARNYTPAFQPIDGQWWYLKHHLLSDPWAIAAKDLPLNRYTRMDFQNARHWYEDPPWDWWKLDFVGRYKGIGNLLLALFMTGFVAGAILWIRGLRSATAPCAGNDPSGLPRLWPRLRAYLGQQSVRLRDRLRGRGR
jgi:4-amino-4-deoxy-L-arabinose transferase and related glycosyltransferases of PMT family